MSKPKIQKKTAPKQRAEPKKERSQQKQQTPPSGPVLQKQSPVALPVVRKEQTSPIKQVQPAKPTPTMPLKKQETAPRAPHSQQTAKQLTPPQQPSPVLPKQQTPIASPQPIKQPTPPKEELAPPTLQKQQPDGSITEVKNEVESLLFSSGKSMNEESLVNLTHRDPAAVKQALKALQQEYAARNCALALYEDNAVWRLNVREKYVKLVRKIVADVEFNKSLLKTLATIAWKSPVLQSEIIRIRSTKGYDHIDELEQAGFIQRERKGRSFAIKTTQKFSDYFDIDPAAMKKAFQNVKQPEQTTLPVVQQASEQQDGLPKTIAGQKTIDHEFLEQIEQKIQAVAKRNQEGLPEEKKEEP